jgi:predicted Zn-dependent protease
MEIEVIKELLESGQADNARAFLLDLVEENPEDHRAWLLLAGIANRSEDWALGRKVFSALVRLRPSDGLASSGFVRSNLEQGCHQEAIDEIERFRFAADRSKPSSDAVLKEHAKTLGRIINTD